MNICPTSLSRKLEYVGHIHRSGNRGLQAWYYEFVILVNFKNYKEGVGTRAVGLAVVCEQIAQESGVEIVPVVTALDLYRVKQVVKNEVWVQHVDGIGYGAHTGWELPELAKEAGAGGVVLNHHEHKLLNSELREANARCREVGLRICVCADSVEEAKVVSELGADFVAYEPPELIGGEVSVSDGKADVVSGLIKEVSGVKILIGAGVHTKHDVRIGLELGAVGVLISSGVVLADKPEEVLRDLAGGFKDKS